MIGRLKEHAKQHPREGSRKACEALRREGTRVNHKKVERLWRQHGLTVPVQRRRRRRGKGLDQPLTALYPNYGGRTILWKMPVSADASCGF